MFTPPPSPPLPPVPTPTLPAQINAATRKQHTALNRLIVERLPLALPPYASDPRPLGKGLAAFAEIFFIFERVWRELTVFVETHEESLPGTHDVQLRAWLATLRPPGLERSERLIQDLISIADRTGVFPCAGFVERLRLRDVREEIKAKPHTLLAYGWVMYMATFSGGRWVRQQLANAGEEFWLNDSSILDVGKESFQLLELPGFTFLSFDGSKDGEDIKELFKARLAEAETLLTQQERLEVVQAAQVLFERCIGLVTDLDVLVGLRRIWDRWLLPGLLCIAGVMVLVFLYWCSD